MYPVIFETEFFTLRSYDLLWLIALSLAMYWSVKRFSLYFYSLDEELEARRVISWSFIAMLIGAAVIKPLLHINFYIKNPALILTQGGLSEIGAVGGAFLAAFLMCRKNKKLSFQKLCDIAALPAMLAIAIGRWGCFLNGCCVGIISDGFYAVHFPKDAVGIMRHPTQIYYSVFAFISLIFLVPLERKIINLKKSIKPKADAQIEQIEKIEDNNNYHAVIAPLTLILYAIMRFSIDILREELPGPEPIIDLGISPNILILLIAFPFEVLWLIKSLKSLKNSINLN